MELILQPYKSKICGHCCVAMVAGVPVSEVIEYIGHSKGTKTREIVRALRHFGTTASNRLVVNRGKIPSLCIAKVNLPNTRNWHWIVYNKGIVFCPSKGSWPYGDYNSRIASYLEILN